MKTKQRKKQHRNTPISNITLLLHAVVAMAFTGHATTQLPAAGPEPLVRELFVPFEDLDVVLKQGGRRVFLTRVEYDNLLAKASVSIETPAPRATSVLSANYVGQVTGDRATITGTLLIDITTSGIHPVPLPLDGVGLLSARLDDKPASISQPNGGVSQLFVEGRGRHELKLELVLPVEVAAAQQKLAFRLPHAGSGKFQLNVPGNIEVKSGMVVLSRQADPPNTQFELLPQANKTELLLSLNNKTSDDSQLVIGRIVLIDELTETYERLHITASMQIPHGASDRFRFAIPDGFDVTEVNTALLSRWKVVEVEGNAILEVQLRESAAGTQVLNISAQRNAPDLTEWTMPLWTPLDVAGTVSVVGLLMDERLEAQSLEAEGLIRIDVTTLTSTLPDSLFQAEPGAPAITPIAAYFSPDNAFSLRGSFQKPAVELDVTTNQILSIDEAEQKLNCEFTLYPLAERTFACNLLLDAGWEVLTANHGGQELGFETHVTTDGRTRIHIQLHESIPAGGAQTIQVAAIRTPDDWLSNWESQETEFPKFEVMGASRTSGAMGVHAGDDLVLREQTTTGLFPLDEKEKAAYGLVAMDTSLAFRFERTPFTATFIAERVPARITAETYSFLKIEPARLLTHYELVYDVVDARTRELAFSFPLSTPKEIQVEGFDGVRVKEFTSREEENTRRRWDVTLATPTRGTVRLKVSFEQPLALDAMASDGGTQLSSALSLPIIQAQDIKYQTGSISVEGSSELEIELGTTARRVDVGELIEATYQPGRRLLGAYGFVGTSRAITAKITRPLQYGLPSALIQRAELVSALSNAGLCQTAARFELRAKSQFIEVHLPLGSTLWSAYLDGSPSKPQRHGERLLISIPSNSGRELRNLQLVYETPVEDVGMVGDLAVTAPKLFLQDNPQAAGVEVPMADLSWHVSLPAGYRMASSHGSVHPILQNPTTRSHLAEYVPPFEKMAAVATQRNGIPVSEASAQVDISEASDAPSAGTTIDLSASMASPNEESFYPYDYKNVIPQSPAKPATTNYSVQVPQLSGAPQTLAEFQGVDSDSNVDSSGIRPGQDATGPNNVASKTRPSSGKHWALEGLRSLKIDLATHREKLAFASLGEAPQLSVTVVDYHRIELLAWGIALGIVTIGLLLIKRTWRTKFRYVLLILCAATLLPLLFGWQREFGRIPDLACYAGVVLLPIYLMVGLLQGIQSRIHWQPVVQAALLLCLLSTFSDTAAAQQETEATVGSIRVKLIGPETPVTVPRDVVIVPYDPAQGTDAAEAEANAERIIVPYEKYVELWDLAYPDRKLASVAPPAEFAWAGSAWNATLADDETLLLRGELTIDTFVDRQVAVPLEFSGGVLEQANLDGNAARIAGEYTAGQDIEGDTSITADANNSSDAQQATANSRKQAAEAPSPKSILLIDSKGRHTLKLAIRFRLTRRGGWRVVDGGLPHAAASKLTINVPEAKTELRFPGGMDRSDLETSHANEVIDTALAADGMLRFQWRPKVSQAAVDQSLTVRSDAVFDVQEDSLRLVWRMDFLFPRASRDAFEFRVDEDYLVQRVDGQNIRSWQRKDGLIQVLLLNPVRDKQRLSVHLTRRGAVGEGEIQNIQLPSLEIPDAVLHEGRVALRRSPLLQVRATKTEGLVRTDLASVDTAKSTSSASPLGIKPFQAYRFNRTPFTLALSANRVATQVKADVQSLLNIGETHRSLEARILLQTNERPVHRVTLQLPTGFALEEIVAPRIAHSSTTEENGMKKLTIHLANGQLGDFSVVLSGDFETTDATPNASEDRTFELPKVVVQDVVQQTTMIVVQADPSYGARTARLANCEVVLLERAYEWLQPNQRGRARFAIESKTADFDGSVVLQPRTPRITCRTISNLRITPRAFEETILVDFQIQDAGAREVSFLLPADLRDARISAPLIRRKTIEDVSVDQIRVRLQLKDAVMGELRVLIQHDRLVTSDERSVPIPVVETGEMGAQFVALESAGRDEVLVSRSQEVEALSRQQSQWRTLSSILGDQVTQAYLVANKAQSPELVVQTKDRQTVETVGARVAFAETLLVVDTGGAYRGTQTYQVDNRTEQFLEVRLPTGATLWTAKVSNEPVKPIVGQDVIRIPLVKTAEGDQAYAVELKYGGTLEGLKPMAKVNFPLMQTINIKVEESQVRLRLPASQRWYGFDGTMRNVAQQADLTAGFLQYKTQQLQKFTSGLSSSNPYARARCLNNIKLLVDELEQLDVSGVARNSNLQEQLGNNQRALEIAKRQVGSDRNAAQARYRPMAKPAVSNYHNLNTFFLGQQNAITSREGKSSYNFPLAEKKATEQGRKSGELEGTLQRDWIVNNGLSNRAIVDGTVTLEGRVNINTSRKKNLKGAAGRNAYGQDKTSQSITENGRGQQGRHEYAAEPQNGDGQRRGGYGGATFGTPFDDSGVVNGGSEAGDGEVFSGGAYGVESGDGGGYGGGGGGYGGYGGGQGQQLGDDSVVDPSSPQSDVNGPSSRASQRNRVDKMDRVERFQQQLSQQQRQQAGQTRHSQQYPYQRAVGRTENVPRRSVAIPQQFSQAYGNEGRQQNQLGLGTTGATQQGATQYSETQQDGGQPGTTASMQSPRHAPFAGATGLASLDVAFPIRGVEYMFTTPRGNIQITARPMDAQFVRRMERLVGTLALLAVLALIYRTVLHFGFDRIFTRTVCGALLAVGILLLVLALPWISLCLVLFAVIQFVRLAYCKSPTAVPA